MPYTEKNGKHRNKKVLPSEINYFGLNYKINYNSVIKSTLININSVSFCINSSQTKYILNIITWYQSYHQIGKVSTCTLKREIKLFKVNEKYNAVGPWIAGLTLVLWNLSQTTDTTIKYLNSVLSI